jgi:transcriptional regulator with XRE-family HTH domain
MTQGSLATRLRVLRARRGLSLTDAANLAGIQRQTLAKLERGGTRPHDVTLSKIAAAYEVPVEALLEEPALAGKDEAPDTGQAQPSTGTVEEFEQRLARVLEPVRAEALHDQQALNRFFASEGIERDYSGPTAEAEAWKRFLENFSPEERPRAFSAVLLGYARLEQANVNLEANFTRLRKLLQERDEKSAKMDTYNIGREIEKIYVSPPPSRAEAERQVGREHT